MNCKDFHTEVEDGVRGASLSASADTHAADCPPCDKFGKEYFELQEWMAVCRKITAPKDFQFGVQRKIATAQSINAGEWVRRSLRFIVPASAAAAVLALGINFSYQNKTEIVQAGTVISNKADKIEAVPLEVVPQISEIASGPVDPAKTTTAPDANKATNNVKQALPKQNQDSEKVGGSLDQGATNKSKTDLPVGLSLPKSGAESLSSTLRSLLNLGAVTNLQMQVVQVRAGSAAAAAGIKVGDVVENFNGKTLSINRAGQNITLTVK
jgi:hypothetical protein